VFATIFGILVTFANDLYEFIPLFWCLLFCGASVAPTATGIIIDSVEAHYMSASSSLSQIMYNLVGFAAGIIVSGTLMSYFTDSTDALNWGFKFVVYWNTFTLFFLLAAWKFSLNI